MTKKWLVAVLAGAAMVLSTGALAQKQQAATQGFYVGGDFGKFDIADEDDTAFKILGGYQFHRNFSAEFSYGNLFDKSERAQSSGCIRVENPLELAALLLENQSGWDRAAIDRAVEEGKTRTVTLAKRVPVLLAYWTAWVDIDGKLQLRRDVYSRDPEVARGLAERFRVREPVASR